MKNALLMVAELILTIALVFASVFVFGQIHDWNLIRQQDKVVMITNLDHTHGGTGFFVKTPSGRNLILTNNHVCNLAQNGVVSIEGKYLTSVLAVYPLHDLCVLNNPLNSPGFTVAKSVSNHETISILGHPLLDPLSLVHGEISGSMIIKIQYGENIPCEGPTYENHDLSGNPIAEFLGLKNICLRVLEANPVTATIYPGNSGSPVFNKYGHIVGVVFAGRDGGPGFIVPLSFIQDFLGGL